MVASVTSQTPTSRCSSRRTATAWVTHRATKTRVAGHGGPTQPTGGTSTATTAAATTTWSRHARSGVLAARPSGSAIIAATTGMKLSQSALWSRSSWVLQRNVARAASHRTGVR
jgi:hypothetical protein